MIVGVDLGTSFSSIGFVNEEAIPTVVGDPKFPNLLRIPSLVGFAEQGCWIGHSVERLIADYPHAAIARYAKQELGSGESVVHDDLGQAWRADPILSLVLAKLRDQFIAAGHGTIESAVLAVPANFTDGQRRAIRRSADLLGLPVHSLVDTPVAAGRFLVDATTPQTVLICDFGAGSFEASLLRCSGGERSLMASESDTALGGREWHAQLASQFAAKLELPIDLGDNDKRQRLLEKQLLSIAEQSIVRFYESHESTIEIRQFVLGKPLEFTLTQSHFDHMAIPMLRSCVEVVLRCLQSAGFEPNRLDQVWLIGGGSRWRHAASTMAEALGIPATRVAVKHPLTAVTFGISLLAADFEANASPKSRKANSVNVHAVGIRVRDTQSNKTTIYEQIRRNLPLPVHVKKIFKTSRIDQERMIVELVQYKDSYDTAVSLGNFEFGPIHPQSASHPIEISIHCDRDGIVHVSGKDPLSKQTIPHRILSSRLSQPDPRSLVEDRALIERALIHGRET